MHFELLVVLLSQAALTVNLFVKFFGSVFGQTSRHLVGGARDVGLDETRVPFLALFAPIVARNNASRARPGCRLIILYLAVMTEQIAAVKRRGVAVRP